MLASFSFMISILCNTFWVNHGFIIMPSILSSFKSKCSNLLICGPVSCAADSENEIPSDVGSPIISEDGAEELKITLLNLAASTSRGEVATEMEKMEALKIIEMIEMQNSMEDPAKNAFGSWDLVYSNTYLFRSSPFFMAARAVCKDGVEADRFNWFCKQHREALAFTYIGKVRQIVSPTSLTSEFETNVAAVPGLPLTITGTIVSNADIEEMDGSSWTLYMDKVRIKEDSSNIPILGQLLNDFNGLQSRKISDVLDQFVESYSIPKPIFRTNYVDKDMRISRDQDNNVFVYCRSSSVDC